MQVGRNDPCHCGSGLKYKKCCLPKEETRRLIRVNQLSQTELKDFHDLTNDTGKVSHGAPWSPIMNPEHEQARYVSWEYDYIRSEIGDGYKRLHQALLRDEKRMMDRIVVAKEGVGHVFYFDITEQLTKLGNVLSAAAEKMGLDEDREALA